MILEVQILIFDAGTARRPMHSKVFISKSSRWPNKNRFNMVFIRYYIVGPKGPRYLPVLLIKAYD